MEKFKSSVVEKFRFEQICLILIILASDLSKLDDGDLVLCAEWTEGEIEVLFTRQYLSKFDESYGFTENIIIEMEGLIKSVTALYKSQWHKLLKETGPPMTEIKLTAAAVMKTLHLEFSDPMKYAEDNLDMDWISYIELDHIE